MSQLASKLRKNPTPAEVRFWKIIESFRVHHHFRKQVQGETHFLGDAPQRDQKRDAALAARGYRVLRIPNDEVMRNPDGVYLVVSEALARANGQRPPPYLR